MTNRIVFTGGGSGGHVTLNLALIPFFLDKGYEVVYIGSYEGIERELIKKYDKVKYYPIHTGKLRRYFSWQNFVDMMKIPFGILEALWIVFKEQPNIVFSKGGFVSFPVVVAGFLCRKPVLMHESDVTPGLSNKMSLPFVSKFFTTFQDTIKYVKKPSKVEYIGPVLSDRLKNGDTKKALELCGFSDQKPILMFMGGSLGAKSINDAVRQNLKELLKNYQIIHLCGKGQSDLTYQEKGYVQFDYVDSELKDLLKAADVVFSRSGSNAIFELLSEHKPMILVPLSGKASRGEQMLNAKSFQKKGYAEIITDDELGNTQKFFDVILKVYQNREQYRQTMEKSDFKAITNEELAKKIMQMKKSK